MTDKRPDAPAPPDEAKREVASLLSPRKLATQLLGFAIGAALLAWCIYMAVQSGTTEQGESGWQKLADANPWLIAGLIGTTVVSLFINGGIFWIVIRPVYRVKLSHMMWLNLTVSLLNYAPIRLGLIARVAYHIRVDRMPLLRMGAWFAAIGYTLLLALGACVMATIVWASFDLIWAAIVLGQLLLGGLITRAIMGHPLIVKYGKGMDQMLREHSALWGAIGMRLIDLGAYVGRMACAAAILELGLSAADVLLLGFAALALSLNPLGRFGFREAAVTFVAARLVSGSLDPSQIGSQMAVLALIESAGEAITSISLGIFGLMWYRKQWVAARRNGAAEDD